MNLFHKRHLVLALATTFALVAIAAPANAATPIGSDGQIHACYKAKGKGKAKGAVRLVAPGKACKGKEKAIAWSASGGSQSGVTPQQLFALLELIQKQGAQIDALAGQVGGLDDVLGGLIGQVGSLEDLLGTLTGRVGGLEDILAGITNGDLLGLLDTLPLVDDLCSQLSVVTGQANSLLTVLDGLGLNGVLTALGGVLNVPALPAALDPFNCPA